MKRFSISLALAAVSTFFAYGAFGAVIQPQPLKTIATVVVHAHHTDNLSNFLSATDKL